MIAFRLRLFNPNASNERILEHRGQWYHKHLAFNANLQEFAQRTTYISNLETNGKLSPEEAYQQIKRLWKQLKRSKKQYLPLHPRN